MQGPSSSRAQKPSLSRVTRSLVAATVRNFLPSRSDTPAASAPGTVRRPRRRSHHVLQVGLGLQRQGRATSRSALATSTRGPRPTWKCPADFQRSHLSSFAVVMAPVHLVPRVERTESSTGACTADESDPTMSI